MTTGPLPPARADFDVEFASLPDLASRQLGGSVIVANDEFFADKANLILPGRAQARDDFGHRGKEYDGWETRRRRDEGHDHAIIRLGAAGIVRGVVIDTAFFRGNYPPFVSVEATSAERHPGVAELRDAEWVTLVEKSPAKGDSANVFEVHDERRFTHVRLSIYPDGGVARFRVHGEAVPDPRLFTGTVDLAAQINGGLLVACSNMFYSSPANLLLPGRARDMGEGWETARRRDGGNDWVVVRLAAPGIAREIDIDTSYFVGNAPGWAEVSAIDASTIGEPAALADRGEWHELMPRTPLQPDALHRFRVHTREPITHVRVDIIPDGGFARLHVRGELPPESLREVTVRWLASLPSMHLEELLSTLPGIDETCRAAARTASSATGPTSWPDDLINALRLDQ